MHGHRTGLTTGRGLLIAADEAVLLDALQSIHSGRHDEALDMLATLVARNPEFRLAQLVYADLLLAKSRPLDAFGGDHARAAGASALLSDLREEARLRMRQGGIERPTGAVPGALVRLSPSQRQAIVIDVSESRLFLFDNDHGAARLAGSYYVTTGKNGPFKAREGDQKTPLGVYFLTGRIGPSKLPDFYGTGALPVNYPNEWDRRLGRTGFGIWIHGVPSNTYARAPRASDGCMALANDDLTVVWGMVDTADTPVIIAHRLRWRSRDEIKGRRRAFDRRLDSWRLAWESRDISRYAQYYSKQFHSEDLNFRQWIRHKSRVNARKRYIRVRLSDVSVFGYPAERDLMVVTFVQDYRSSNFNNRIPKRQYWHRDDDGSWRIVYEGVVKLREEHLKGVPFSARSGMLRIAN